jgi:hypothetical protein
MATIAVSVKKMRRRTTKKEVKVNSSTEFTTAVKATFGSTFILFIFRR